MKIEINVAIITIEDKISDQNGFDSDIFEKSIFRILKILAIIIIIDKKFLLFICFCFRFGFVPPMNGNVVVYGLLRVSSN
ncbi:hypothetical protein BST83_06805 [Polaribacter filamentus]|uniref:Uncharacterized protein n=1 Tax=Polaribacter filamentus TaxID=53483 RepID=A0A2S7KWL0_9FLAO|nr:hypothetical protein BST83_06805 [Polaribacter filamentus]